MAMSKLRALGKTVEEEMDVGPERASRPTVFESFVAVKL